MTSTSNDNDRLGAFAHNLELGANGQAALLLVESLIHGLIERSMIKVAEAIEIVETAADVAGQIAEDQGASDTTARSIALIQAIGSSLKRYG